MQVAPAPIDEASTALGTTLTTAWYSILGVPFSVASDVDEALCRVDETYAAFRAPPGQLGPALSLRLERLPDGAGYIVSDATGARRWPAYDDALLDLFDRMVHALLGRLLSQGIYAIHAGAVVQRGGALVLAGRSGHGKTTLVLGLLRRGMRLLSDEFAVAEPAAQRIVPYRRSLHVRPGTPELIPELRYLHDLPRHQLGGGSEWAVAPRDLDRALPGCLGEAAPLQAVLLLEGSPRAGERPAIAPLPGALAAIELLRGTWGASVDFERGLARISRLIEGVPCGRLRVGALDATVECVMSWLEAQRG